MIAHAARFVRGIQVVWTPAQHLTDTTNIDINTTNTDTDTTNTDTDTTNTDTDTTNTDTDTDTNTTNIDTNTNELSKLVYLTRVYFGLTGCVCVLERKCLITGCPRAPQTIYICNIICCQRLLQKEDQFHNLICHPNYSKHCLKWDSPNHLESARAASLLIRSDLSCAIAC